ncbi:Tetracycline resistance protein, class C [compost metagenome]
MEKRTILILFATLFCVMTGFGIIIPALPYLTVDTFKLDSRTVGLLLASYSAMNVLCAPFWGRLSDRIGRKPVLLTGLAGLAVSFVIFGLAQDPWVLFASRIVGGAFGAAALPTAMAYAGDVTSDESRAKALGMLGAGLGLGMVVGPAIGGIAGGIGGHNASLPFFVAAGLTVLTALFVLLALPARQPSGAARLGLLEALKKTGQTLWPFYLLSFIQMLAFTNMEATFVLYAKDRFQLTMTQVGLMFMAMGLVSAGFQGGGVGKLITRFGEAAITRSGCAVLAMGFVLTPLAQNPMQLLGAFCFFGVGSALLRTSLSTGVSRGASAGQGTAMGIMQSSESLARVFGPALGGVLYYMAPGLPYQAGAAVMATALVLAFVTLKGTAPARAAA